jgi:hypothetical protein
MKNLILILLTTFALSCCDKDDDKTPIEQLPSATTTGANTAGCLVNGRVFLRKGNNQFGPTLSCFYQQDKDGYHFGLSIVEKSSSEVKSANISLNPNELAENSTYTLGLRTNNGTSYNSNFGEYIMYNNVDSGKEFRTSGSNTGEIKITKLDVQQRIISGTFWYKAILSGEIIEVREGRFDMRYVN